jgi:hypothetical protein
MAAAAGRAKAFGAAGWLKVIGGVVVVAGAAGSVAVRAVPTAARPEASTESRTETPAPTVQHPLAMPLVVPPAAIAAETAIAPTVSPGVKAPRADGESLAGAPLARELRALEAARSALAGGDVTAAFAALDRYDRTFRGGALRTEAAILRVEALLARGDIAAARDLARELLERDPSGPHARRLRTLLQNR